MSSLARRLIDLNDAAAADVDEDDAGDLIAQSSVAVECFMLGRRKRKTETETEKEKERRREREKKKIVGCQQALSSSERKSNKSTEQNTEQTRQ